jgi:hypothetical protein
VSPSAQKPATTFCYGFAHMGRNVNRSSSSPEPKREMKMDKHFDRRNFLKVSGMKMVIDVE